MTKELGMSNYEALKTGTVNAARYIGNESVSGKIEEGCYADLVILNNNPLEDITATRDIFAVIKQGKYLSRDMLNDLLNETMNREIDKVTNVYEYIE